VRFIPSETKRIPNIGELVIANISKIAQFGAYCRLPEYNDIEVFLPIREVSSGWIKNIHEFIHEGQKVVCKVVYYDRERGSIDVSLKKVTAKESKDKIGSYNLEKRLDALFTQALKVSKVPGTREAFEDKLLSEFGSYTNMMRNLIDGTEAGEKSALPKKLRSTLVKLYEANKPEKKFIVSYIMTLSSYNTRSGVQELREILTAVKEKGVDVRYISAPRYRLVSQGDNYNQAEIKIKDAMAIAQSKMKKGVVAIEKEKIAKKKESVIESL
jgi:translation initiation factor 2 subunit 1